MNTASNRQLPTQTVVIVGGIAGGASCAARMRRLDEDATIIMFERGPHVSLASCGLSYYVSGEIAERKKLLVQTPESFRRRFNVDVRTDSEVLSINRGQKSVDVIDHQSGKRYSQHYDKLVLSPGAAPVRPPLPGIENDRIFSLRTLDDADRIKTYVEKQEPRTAAVIGGGFIGLEMTECLRNMGLAVTLIEMANQVMLQVDEELAQFIQQHMKLKGVDVLLGRPVESFREALDGRLSISVKDGPVVLCDFAVCAIGVKPETMLARQAGLELATHGGIRVNANLQTSDPDVYAIGDVVETEDPVAGGTRLVPLAGPANRQGRIVADHIAGKQAAFPGSLGTTIVRVFDLTVATTGATEKTLQRMGIPYQKSYTHPASHAGYYPGAVPMVIKLLFSPGNGRILGAQVLGVDGIDKRIDVLATAIHARMSARDLAELDLAYAPQFGSAKDTLNIAGYVANNVVEGDIQLFHADELDTLRADNTFLLDVRTTGEFDRGHIDGAVNIPIDEIRNRWAELPKHKLLLVYCLTGIRSYFACRILYQKGVRTRNLSGGYVVYCAVNPAKCPEIPGLRRWTRLLALETFCSTPETRQLFHRDEKNSG